MNHIKCISCKYREQVNDYEKLSGDPPEWRPIRCTRRDSDYYHAWLNINPDGKPLKRVSWSGCEYGERAVRK